MLDLKVTESQRVSWELKGGGVETLKNIMLMSKKDKGQISFHPKT